MMTSNLTVGLRTGVRVASLVLLVAAAAQASPIFIDFSVGTAGDVGSSTLTSPPPGIVVDGYSEVGDVWEPAHLFRRNDPGDNGLGICNDAELPCSISEGDINELDNDGRPELIRLKLPDGYQWVEVRLSSLDRNVGSSDPPERGQMYADTGVGDPNISLGVSFQQFEGGTGADIEPFFSIPTEHQLAPFLFFEPIDWLNGTNFNNDFLVYGASIEIVPEPDSLALLATGLIGLGFLAWRRRKTC